MADSIDQASLPEVPAELKPYQERYERKREVHEYQGVYAHSYRELYALFSDKKLSTKDIAQRLQMHGREQTLSNVRRQFFLNLVPPVGSWSRKKPGIRAAERGHREAEFKEMNEAYQALAEFCKPLVPTVVWTKQGLEISPEVFDIEGIRCRASFYRKAHIRLGKKMLYVSVKLSEASAALSTVVEMNIVFVDIENTAYRETFVFPLYEGRPTPATHMAIPVGRSSTTSGGPRKIDFEKYRGEKGLELLKAMIEKKKTET